MNKVLLTLGITSTLISISYAINLEQIKTKMLYDYSRNNTESQQNQVQTKVLSCEEAGIKGCNFVGLWTGSCNSDPSKTIQLAITAGNNSQKDGSATDYIVTIDGENYSLNHTNTNIKSHSYGQEITNSVLRLENDSKLVLTSKTTENYSVARVLNVNTKQDELSGSKMIIEFSLVDNKLIQTFEYASEAQNIRTSDMCTYTKPQ